MNTNKYKSITNKLKIELNNKDIGFQYEAKNIFLCGAAINDENRSVRNRLLTYYKKYSEELGFFIAENALYTDAIDLLTQENSMTCFTDCLILILESESAFAELGAFTNSPIIERLLIVNDIAFKPTDNNPNASFINNGPIKKALIKSDYKKVVYYRKKECALEIAEDIIIELKKKDKTNNKNYSFSQIQVIYKNIIKPNNQCTHIEYKIILSFYFNIISLFQPISQKSVGEIMADIFNSPENNDFNKKVISMMKALDYIYEISSSRNRKYLVINKDRNIRLNFDFNLKKYKTDIFLNYRKNEPKKIKLFFEYINQRN